MYRNKLLLGLLCCSSVMLSSDGYAASSACEFSGFSLQNQSTTPTQDIIKTIQAGNIEQMKKLWLRYPTSYVDKKAIFKTACLCKQYAFIVWLLKTTSFAHQYYHEYGTTLLIEGVSYNDVKLLAALLASRQIDIDAQTNPGGWTALMIAAEKTSPAVVKFLLKSGANRRVKDFDGRDAEWWAQSVDRAEIIRLLRQNSI